MEQNDCDTATIKNLNTDADDYCNLKEELDRLRESYHAKKYVILDKQHAIIARQPASDRHHYRFFYSVRNGSMVGYTSGDDSDVEQHITET